MITRFVINGSLKCVCGHGKKMAFLCGERELNEDSQKKTTILWMRYDTIL